MSSAGSITLKESSLSYSMWRIVLLVLRGGKYMRSVVVLYMSHSDVIHDTAEARRVHGTSFHRPAASVMTHPLLVDSGDSGAHWKKLCTAPEMFVKSRPLRTRPRYVRP